MSRLDKLIGSNHWLSVGTYKETLLKKALRRVVPQKYSIDSGFVVAADKDGRVIRSTQTDILIWDSANYSPLYRDDDFVLIPPEACKVMIEVKGVLTPDRLRKTLSNFDQMIDFGFTPSLLDFNIPKYLFAFEIGKVKYPDTIFRTIASTYNKSNKIDIDNRMSCYKDWWPTESKPWPLLSIDGIFILSTGFILRRLRGFDDEVRLLFHSFSVKSKNESQVYSVFESEVISSLGQFSQGKQGLWYSDQPGLFSLRSQIGIKPSQPKPLMIFPKVAKEKLYKDIPPEVLFDKF